MISLKSEYEIKKIREAAKVLSQAHKEMEKNLRPGISTYDLDRIAEDFIIKNGGYPATKNYPHPDPGIKPFPGTSCISVNDVIIHGIPLKETILKEGDVVSIDMVVEKDGYYADSARTYIVGKAKSEEDERLIEVTRQAFFEGIKFAKEGFRIGDISHAIQSYVEKNGMQVIREYQGHGIGNEMHEEPGIPNYGRKGTGPRLTSGMVLAIEPMVVQGKRDIFELDDGWTVVVEDGKNSAHYENTILITENLPEILT